MYAALPAQDMTYIKTAPAALLCALLCALAAPAPASEQSGPQRLAAIGNSEGMLFAFEQPSPQCFWMKNTLLPLSIAFLADDGTVVNIEDMAPQTIDSHCSAKPVRYALEMNKGWFAKRGIKAGTKIQGGPFSR